MNRYSPVFLDLHGKNVLVVGAGRIAQRKIETARRAGACVSVVAPRATPKIRGWAAQKKIAWIRRKFVRKDLFGRHLVFCTTDDEDVNARVGQACHQRRIWVNVVDRPALCSFIVPAIVRRGDVVFAISTGGASPALAKFLMRRLASVFGSEVAGMARLLKEERPRLIRLPMPKRKRALERAFSALSASQAGSKPAGPLKKFKRELERITRSARNSNGKL